MAPLSTFVRCVAAATLLTQRVLGTPVMSRPRIYDNVTSVEIEGRYNYDTSEGGTDDIVSYANGKVSFAYWVNWGIYARAFPPQNIQSLKSITHILYSFADTDATTGAIKLTDTYADQEIHFPGDSWSEPGNNLYGALKQMYLIKKANRHIKTLLSIGGWTYSQAGHFNFVTNPSARATFISTAITLLEDNGFDGIDIDYEYPDTVARGEGLASLLTELRAALNQHAARKGETNPYLVTVAVGAGPVGYNYLPIAKMNAALSFWNLMAYDYAGSWSTVSDHQANIYGGSITGFSTETALNHYISNGATPSKIGMGIPLYGRAFDNTAGFQKPFSGVGTGSWENGIWDYKALPRPGHTVTEDTTNVGAYSYGSNLLVSYDTPNIALTKARYINSRGLAGSMFWELSGDKTGSESLVSRVAGILGTLDSTPNHLSFPGSKWDNIKNQMGGTNPTPTPTTGGPTTTPTPTGGTGCAGVAAWSATATYTAGNRVTYQSQLWEAKWWTQNETPAVSDWGVWKLISRC